MSYGVPVYFLAVTCIIQSAFHSGLS